MPTSSRSTRSPAKPSWPGRDWARRASTDALGALLSLAALAGPPAASAAEPGPDSLTVAAAPAHAPPDSADTLEGRTISRVDIVTRNVFDPGPDDPFGRFFSLANMLHMRTRERTVRQLLLFEPGDAFHQERLDESARALRTLDYLEPRRMEARRDGDSVAVMVETRDAWTTSPVINLEQSGGVQYGTIGLSERNLFGLGKTLSFLYHEDPVGILRSLSFHDPAVFGSRVQFGYGAASGTAGSADVLTLAQPFYSEEASWTSSLSWRRSRSTASLFESGSEVAQIDETFNESEIGAGRGWSRDGQVVRSIGSLYVLHRNLGPTRLGPGAPPDFAGGPDDLWLRRLQGELTVWHPRFIIREDIERIGGKEDFDVGSSASVKAGYAPKTFGSTASEGYLKLDGVIGAQVGQDFGSAHGTISMRLRREPLEVIRRGDLRWYHHWRPGHVLVLSAFGMAGSDVPRDFQVVVGGLNGLRAYPVQALAGRELVRLNAEQRWILVRNRWDLMSVGMAAFYDAARAWGPGAVGTDWFNAAGLGVRLATPRSALSPVIRFDVAWPISPTRDGMRQAVFTFGSSQAF